MIQMTLYKKAGAYSYSLVADADAVPSGLIRLVADDGKWLTNGVDTVTAIDVVSADGWTEVDAPPEPADTDPEQVIAEMEAVL